MYQIELQEGHQQAADAHLLWARDRPREFDLVSARAQWLAWQGRMREARDVYQQVTRPRRPAQSAGDRRRLSGPSGVDRSAVRQQSAALAVARSLFGAQARALSFDSVPRFRATAALALRVISTWPTRSPVRWPDAIRNRR